MCSSAIVIFSCVLLFKWCDQHIIAETGSDTDSQGERERERDRERERCPVNDGKSAPVVAQKKHAAVPLVLVELRARCVTVYALQHAGHSLSQRRTKRLCILCALVDDIPQDR